MLLQGRNGRPHPGVGPGPRALGDHRQLPRPGPFLTDLPGKLLSDEQKQHFAEGTARGRWGRPQELMGPALLLASEAGSDITGSVLSVDGGCLSRVL